MFSNVQRRQLAFSTHIHSALSYENELWSRCCHIHDSHALTHKNYELDMVFGGPPTANSSDFADRIQFFVVVVAKMKMLVCHLLPCFVFEWVIIIHKMGRYLTCLSDQISISLSCVINVYSCNTNTAQMKFKEKKMNWIDLVYPLSLQLKHAQFHFTIKSTFLFRLFFAVLVQVAFVLTQKTIQCFGFLWAEVFLQ